MSEYNELSSQIIDYCKSNFWSDEDGTAAKVFSYMTSLYNTTLIEESPQIVGEAMRLLKVYDDLWRLLANEYYLHFKKFVIDFEHFSRTVGPVIRDYYVNGMQQQSNDN
jgi:hypothetical protein